jgi:DNA-binding MarR family transcriptional regulator
MRPAKNAQSPVPEIMDALRRIMRALRTSSKASEQSLGLRTAQVFVLQQLRLFAPLSVNDLAGRTYSHQSTVSVVIDGLVKLGYVEKSPSPEDQRKVALRLSAAGKKLLKGKQNTMQERFAAAIERMPPKDSRLLADLLGAFVEEAGLSGDAAHFFFEAERPTRR